MSLLWYTLAVMAAMAGGIVGKVAHEAIHIVLAVALGELVEIGWAGGSITGYPYVDFRAPTRFRSEIIRKGPLAVGVGGATVVITTATPSLAWLVATTAVVGLLWTSPADLFLSSAHESAGE